MKRRDPDFFIIGFFAIASAILLGVGCGQKQDAKSTGSLTASNSPIPSQSGAFHIPKDAVQNSRYFVNHINVACGEAKNDCNPSVAMLAAVHSTGAEVCTAFLIKPNQVLTNSHCVPVELKAAGSKCSGEIQFVFGDQRRVTCSRIVVDSKDQNKNAIQDYAIIELAESLNDRMPFPVSDEGIEDETELKVIHVDPAPEYQSKEGYFFGIMRSHACESMMDHLANPIYQSRFSIDVSIKGCELRPGNSGSPLIDSNGRIRALVNRIFAPTLAGSAASRTSGLLIDTREQSAGATNLACIKELFPRAAQRAECHPDLKTYMIAQPDEEEVIAYRNAKEAKQQLEFQEKLTERVIDKSESLLVARKTRAELDSASDLVRFKAVQKDDPFGYTAAIRCYLPSAETLLRQKDTIEIDYPTLHVSRDLIDDYGRLHTSVEIQYARRTLKVAAPQSLGGTIQIGAYSVEKCRD